MLPSSPRYFVPARRQAMAAGGPKVRFQQNLGMGLNPEVIARWTPSLIIWGVAGGAAVMVALSAVPIFQRDILYKIPGVKGYFEGSKPPPEDMPF